MQFDEVLDDGQSQTEAAVVARRGGIRLAEPLEDVRQKLGSDPCPGVTHSLLPREN